MMLAYIRPLTRPVLPALFIMFCAVQATAQKSATCVVDPSRHLHSISPYIYGSNGQDDDPRARVAARRLGGNRLTAYNWENNASNAGSDWYFSSDDYITWTMGIAPIDEDKAAIAVTTFHDTSRSMGVPSLITLPMAGYVARDKLGQVKETESAPSPRWARVVNRKPTAFSLQPDTTDGIVYTDEFLNFLITKYGRASGADGVRMYALDNEPGLWSTTHARIQKDKLRISDLLTKSIDLAGTVKRMDPDAEVFGPVLYGFNAYLSLQDAPDWSDYRGTYPRFVDAYLDRMKRAGDSAGTRLLDVFDVHWYPDVQNVYGDDTSRTAVAARVQVTRSLWDSSYVEDSWIGQWFSPVAMIPTLQHSIDTYYPGTRLAITEYNYGGASHVSGGVAAADALGIFGRTGVYFASPWGGVTGYFSSAFRIFRNYDGSGGTFGTMSVPVDMSDNGAGAVHAALDESGSRALHLVLINRSLDSTLSLTVRFAGTARYASAVRWYFDRTSMQIRSAGAPQNPEADGSFRFELPPLSVHHAVLAPAAVAVEGAAAPASMALHVAPNPASVHASASCALPSGKSAMLTVHDLLGREVLRSAVVDGGGTHAIPVAQLRNGAYVVTLQNAAGRVSTLLHVVH